MIQSTNNHFFEVLSQLRDCPESLSWPQRREQVAQLHAALAEGEQSPAAFDLIALLATDPKWEVRSDVANLLLFLPPGKFPKIAARLSEDPNAFVRKATARALDRLKRTSENDKREKQGLQYMQSQYELLEKLHGKNITLDVSRHQILVALANIIKNAYEAFFFGFKKRRQMKIRISAYLIDQEKVTILVEDNGVGMAAEDLAEVRQFIPGRTSKRNVGTGFGLPIAKRNLAAHGGSIALESKENKGTKIRILLPLGVDEED